jgi:hypothetical protein
MKVQILGTGFLESARAASANLVLHGCPTACGKNIFESRGLAFRHFDMTEHGVFLFAYFLPFAHPLVSQAVNEALLLLGEYARQHVLLCLVPAFFIAGAIMVFLNQQAVSNHAEDKIPREQRFRKCRKW